MKNARMPRPLVGELHFVGQEEGRFFAWVLLQELLWKIMFCEMNEAADNS